MLKNARNQTVTELGPAGDAIATHCRLTPAVMKYRTTSPKPRTRRGGGAWACVSGGGLGTAPRGTSTGRRSLRKARCRSKPIPRRGDCEPRRGGACLAVRGRLGGPWVPGKVVHSPVVTRRVGHSPQAGIRAPPGARLTDA